MQEADYPPIRPAWEGQPIIKTDCFGGSARDKLRRDWQQRVTAGAGGLTYTSSADNTATTNYMLCDLGG